MELPPAAPALNTTRTETTLSNHLDPQVAKVERRLLRAQRIASTMHRLASTATDPTATAVRDSARALERATRQALDHFDALDRERSTS
jgi:hypothetical protein